jgi:hypothetical protein
LRGEGAKPQGEADEGLGAKMSETLRRVQALVMSGDYIVSRHGFRELAADDIVAEDALSGIHTAIVVEDYPDSRKEPSVLVLQYDRDARPIHVMWAFRRVQEDRRCL